MNNVFNVVELSHFLIDTYLKKGSVCVDATCGNGNDTLYLAEKVGDEGFVYAFDIQQEACITASSLLRRKGIANAKVICDGHENLDEHVFKKIDCAVFNLGYLPSSNSKITTKPQTTYIALTKTLNLLKPEGFIIICVYISHDGGKKEKKMLDKYFTKLDKDIYQILNINQPNQKNLAPEVFFIRKKLIFD